RQALAARAGLERGDLVAPHALAPAHRGDCARAEPPLRGGAQLGTARVAADGEDSAQRLERVERLLELRLERQRRAGGIVRERGPHALLVPARRLRDAEPE